MKNVWSSQAYVSIRSYTKLSKTRFFPWKYRESSDFWKTFYFGRRFISEVYSILLWSHWTRCFHISIFLSFALWFGLLFLSFYHSFFLFLFFGSVILLSNNSWFSSQLAILLKATSHGICEQLILLSYPLFSIFVSLRKFVTISIFQCARAFY